jgi:hypothetical protein
VLRSPRKLERNNRPMLRNLKRGKHHISTQNLKVLLGSLEKLVRNDKSMLQNLKRGTPYHHLKP